MHDKVCGVRRLLRKLLVLMLAAWLPVFAGSALATVVCESHSFGHAFGDHAHADVHASSDGDHHGAADIGTTGGCQNCDSCYSHCTLWLPGSACHPVAPVPCATVKSEPARLNSLTFAPADRPPLARLA